MTLTERLKSVQGVLFDLDGVLYVGERVIDGAPEALRRVRQEGLACRFITNTSTHSLASLHRKLVDSGFEIDSGEIISAPRAARLFLKQQGDPACHLLLAEDVKKEFEALRQSDAKVDFIVVGDIGAAWSYTVLNRAFNLLMGGAQLIAIHKNRFWQTEAGLQMDIGGFVTALEYASGKEATIIGKPSAAFFRIALEHMGLGAQQCAIIGDDIETDVGGGQASGLFGILVKTGKYRDEYARASPVCPDAVLDSVRDLPACLGIGEMD